MRIKKDSRWRDRPYVFVNATADVNVRVGSMASDSKKRDQVNINDYRSVNAAIPI